MKQVSIGLAAFLATALPLGMAQAADMAVKAPAPIAVASADWTGAYLDVGIGWQHDSFNWAYTNFAPAQNAFSLSNGQGSVTGHIGYQQQFNWLVVGGEIGAFKSINSKAATIVSPGGAATAGPCTNVAGFSCQASITSTALAGGKVGVDWGNWLVYGVGGVAFNSGISTAIFNPAGIQQDAGSSQASHGWYLGGGLDYMLLRTGFGDLIGGVEYEHVNLKSVAQCSAPLPGSAVVGGCPGTVAAVSRFVSASEDAVWAKLTLKFDPFNH